MIHTPVAPAGVQVLWMHDSQSPEAQKEARLKSLRTGQIDHQFHYASAYQTELWWELYQRYALVMTSQEVAETYRIFSQSVAVHDIGSPLLHVIGLGSGGAKKDRLFLEALQTREASVRFTPLDVSPSLSLLSARNTADLVDFPSCPLVADLRLFTNLPQVLNQLDGGKVPRVYTFYGMLPNFAPEEILPLLHSWLRPQDILLLSANLVPGDDLAVGLNKILPQYNNPYTQSWLLRVLVDWGLEKVTSDYRLDAQVLSSDQGKYEASVAWTGPEAVAAKVKRLRLFYSYRYTKKGVERLLVENGFELLSKGHGVDVSGEEGVWAVRPALGK